ncbi:peptidase inhibitor family I36 protein [Nocardiopsis sp. NPDC049922]|uniref:peptidase inhibitor family I36 protein n=1 Tax=Nocardiopsis sp. NPDC049922 TaxID=3155157 RepID=UPI0033C24806
MSGMKRKITTAGVMASIALAGVLGIAPAASAAAAPTVGAQASYLYIYEHDDYKGGYARFSGNDSNLSNNCWSGSGCRVVNDNASSMRNQTSRGVSMYKHSNYSGPSYYAQPRSSDKDLTNNGFDNNISSIRFW